MTLARLPDTTPPAQIPACGLPALGSGYCDNALLRDFRFWIAGCLTAAYMERCRFSSRRTKERHDEAIDSDRNSCHCSCLPNSSQGARRWLSRRQTEFCRWQCGRRSWFLLGSGALNFQGKTYKVKVTGFSVGDVGVASIDATADVYNLTDIADFDGNYAAAGIGATLAGGGTVMAMENPHGVVIQVRSTTAGLDLNLGPSGITFTVKQ